jgi:hypothetical protein
MAVRKKMKPGTWAKEHFSEGEEPCQATLRKWIDRGALEGMVIDGRYYTYSDAVLIDTRVRTCDVDDFLAA